jgi:hypothetical protein
MDNQGIVGQFPAGTRDFPLLCTIQTGSGAHAAFYIRILEVISSGIMQQRCEADHSFPSTAKVKNRTAISPPPHRASRSDV